MEMQQLTGSEKQVVWANEIRERMVGAEYERELQAKREIRGEVEPGSKGEAKLDRDLARVAAAREWALSHTQATWWINNYGRSNFHHAVKAFEAFQINPELLPPSAR